MAKRGVKPMHVTGRRYGSLVLAERLTSDHAGHTLARYDCDCGGERVARVSTIASTKAQHCGDTTKHPIQRPASPRPLKHRPGDRFGSLVLVERRGKVKGSDRVLVRCDCGTEKEVGLPNLLSGATTKLLRQDGPPDPRRKTGTVAYSTAHHRVRARKGRASEHRCARCGDQAEQWAFSHAELSPLRETEEREAGQPYSPDPDHYRPLCRSCHQGFDRAHRAIVGDSGSVSLVHVAAWYLQRGESTLVVVG